MDNLKDEIHAWLSLHRSENKEIKDLILAKTFFYHKVENTIVLTMVYMGVI